ncbi:MAG: ribosome recycling factor [Clostridiales bacterium]|nr:ribosome recycling factor [Clostridiales bacterium]
MQNEEQIEELQLDYSEQLEKAYNHLLDEYQIIRAGRANPHILDRVMVEYYGVMTPINQMANIQVPEARMIVVSVWDSSQLKNISKAISMADLGVNPTDDGKVIRLVFPPLTEDRRRELAKQVKKLLEETKIVMRNARRDILEKYKSFKKDSKISEDEYAGLEVDVQKELDAMCAKADKASVDKEKEIMEI